MSKQLYRNSLLVIAIVTTLVLTACGTPNATPNAASSQRHTVAALTHTAPFSQVFEGFKAGMTALGYIEGTNIEYLYDGPAGSIEALEPALQKLLGQNPDLLLTFATPPTVTAQKALEGKNIPVIFGPVNDPLGLGIVQDLARPSGNFTGVRVSSSESKVLEWLLKIAPDTKRIYVPHVPADDSSVLSLKGLQETATAAGIELVVAEVQNAEELTAAFNTMPDDVDAAYLLRSGTIQAQIDEFVAAANERQIPIASTTTDMVRSGVTIGYGEDFFKIGEQLSHLADQIFRGTSPADIPVESCESYLYINLKSAEAIHINIPDVVLRQAQTVIKSDNQ